MIKPCYNIIVRKINQMAITRKGGKKMKNTIQINDITLKLDYELKTEKLFKEDGPL